MLLGEASHGTHEFYRERAEITTRLIAEAAQRVGFCGLDPCPLCCVAVVARGASGGLWCAVV